MITVRNEFNDRVIEIGKYFQLLEKLELDYNTLSSRNQIEAPFPIDVDLFRILKANGFLLLYNLIESTILNSVIAIFDELSFKNHCCPV